MVSDEKRIGDRDRDRESDRDREIERYRQAATSALEQLAWVGGSPRDPEATTRKGTGA
jgi:hypothetical protein